MKNKTTTSKKLLYLRVGFSLKKETFFVVLGSILGGFTMHLPILLLDLSGTQYFITLLAMAKVVNSNSVEAGFALHMLVATIIGIVTGLFLHKVIIFNISRISKGIVYGIFAGGIVFAVFSIEVSQLLLGPNTVQILTELDPDMSLIEASETVKENFVSGLINSFVIHMVWGATLGGISSLLTGKFGANFRCHRCNIEFSKILTYQDHAEKVHDNPSSSSMKHIVILGGGFAGIEVLKKLQKFFETNIHVSIDLVSQDNFFLHTPLLPEMASGMLASRHIATPIRSFCKRARFYLAKVEDIDLKENKVLISRDLDSKKIALGYDFLVIALGGKTNFFGNNNIKKYALTIKTFGDAIRLRNHVISMLENADQEDDPQIVSKLMTFVVVGGGFSGVETVGEINDFLRDSVEKFYRRIDPQKIRIVLVSSGEKILPEIGELGDYAKKFLKENGVEIITGTKLADVDSEHVFLSNEMKIPYSTLIWAGGVTVDDVISQLDTEHAKNGRLVVDPFLRLAKHPNVFALGDCALVTDSTTGNPYPPTAQHAVREAKVVSNNLISAVVGNNSLMKSFVYDSKGSMAKIGRHNGVALIGRKRIRGFAAWFLWRQYYLSTLPSNEKKFRVTMDWFADLFFPRDITSLTGIISKNNQ